MPIIELEILGSAHKLVCDNGDEHKLVDISQRLNKRLSKLQESSPTASDTKILVVSAIQMESEILELKESIEHLRNQYNSREQQAEPEELLSKTLDTVTEYVENLAKRLKKI